MSILNRKYNTKKCPRCGEKNLINQPVCHECGLVFARLANLSSVEGKKAVLHREKDKVIRMSAWPDDVKRWKALVYCGVLGLFGAHNFYLGRYVKGVYILILTVLTAIFASVTIYPKYWDTYMLIYSLLGGGFPLLFWVLDFVYIAIGKYKIPLAQYPETENKPSYSKDRNAKGAIIPFSNATEKEDLVNTVDVDEKHTEIIDMPSYEPIEDIVKNMEEKEKKVQDKTAKKDKNTQPEKKVKQIEKKSPLQKSYAKTVKKKVGKKK